MTTTTPSPNVERFTNLLTEKYTELFATDPRYTGAAKILSPNQLADTMTSRLRIGKADKEGTAVKHACKSLGIKNTFKDIAAFLNG